ncbi:MAG: hypothetical protein AAFN92_04210 [Bacteroidota bacterium]
MKLLPFLLLLLALGLGCEREALAVPALPPLLGFGDTTGIISITGEELEVAILWTRALTQVQSIAFQIAGDGSPAADLEVLTPSPLVLEPGATEAVIRLRVVAGPADPTRLDRGGTITLQEDNWMRLTDRQTFSFGYSVPHTTRVELWTPDLAFPKLFGYTSFGPDPVPDGSGLDAGKHFAFGYASRTQPNVLGMYNTSPGRSTNALNLHRIYADYDVGTGSANIRIPELFRLIPAGEGATSGRVEVIEQRITITRTNSSGLPPFEVGLSGSGTYDEDTGIILVDVYFDETALGNGDAILRRYSYESKER